MYSSPSLIFLFEKFLHDLTEADTLIHILYASGNSDKEGNKVVVNDSRDNHYGGSNPINDLGWIFEGKIIHTQYYY